MAIFNEIDERKNTVIDVARKMLVAARTAPKGKGADNMEMAILTDNDIRLLAIEMRKIGEQKEYDIFIRDADNILANADAVVLIGTSIKTPATVASAAPEPVPYRVRATAMATSK